MNCFSRLSGCDGALALRPITCSRISLISDLAKFLLPLIMELLHYFVKNRFFQEDKKFFIPMNELPMGSRMSSTITNIYIVPTALSYGYDTLTIHVLSDNMESTHLTPFFPFEHFSTIHRIHSGYRRERDLTFLNIEVEKDNNCVKTSVSRKPWNLINARVEQCQNTWRTAGEAASFRIMLLPYLKWFFCHLTIIFRWNKTENFFNKTKSSASLNIYV